MKRKRDCGNDFQTAFQSSYDPFCCGFLRGGGIDLEKEVVR